MRLQVFIFLFITLLSTSLKGNYTTILPFPFYTTSIVKTPLVFRMDRNPVAMEVLDKTYEKSLMNACNNDMQIAFGVWRSSLKAMQDFAKQTSFPIDGVKMWMKVYCTKKGKIKHIAFLPTPDSKNIPEGFMESFLERFMKKHKMQIKAKTPYFHYGIASFPL